MRTAAQDVRAAASPGVKHAEIYDAMRAGTLWYRGERPRRMLGFTWRAEDADADAVMRFACDVTRPWGQR